MHTHGEWVSVFVLPSSRQEKKKNERYTHCAKKNSLHYVHEYIDGENNIFSVYSNYKRIKKISFCMCMVSNNYFSYYYYNSVYLFFVVIFTLNFPNISFVFKFFEHFAILQQSMD